MWQQRAHQAFPGARLQAWVFTNRFQAEALRSPLSPSRLSITAHPHAPPPAPKAPVLSSVRPSEPYSSCRACEGRGSAAGACPLPAQPTTPANTANSRPITSPHTLLSIKLTEGSWPA